MAKKTVDNRKRKKRGQPSDEVAGIHIYKDDHNRYVYYDVFSKNGYVLNDIPKYKTYSSRFLIAFIAGVLIATFEIGILLSVLLGLIVYAVMEFKFRSYLKEQTMLPKFKRQERPPRLLTAASEETKKICIRIVLYILVSVLFILLILSEPQYETYLKILCVFLSIGAFAMAIFQVYALFYKKKHNIQTK